MPHTQAHSYKAAFPKRNTIFHNAAAAYKASRTNVHTAIEDGAGRDMTVVFDYRVMFNQCTRIDDTVFAHEIGDWMILTKHDYQAIYKGLNNSSK